MEHILAINPTTRDAARANRAFMRRAVHTVVSGGITQILDIGTGIPTSPNTHEIAQAIAPDARVVYVDNDPIVGVHAHALLTGTGTTAFALADAREPAGILEHPNVRDTLDFSRPVALMLVGVLHFITDREDPQAIVKTLRDALPEGSCLVLSHATSDLIDTREITDAYNRNSSASLNMRSHAQISGFFDGFDLIEPGLVLVADWRPQEPVDPGAEKLGIYGGIGMLRR